MNTAFKVSGLPRAPFEQLIGLDDEALAAHNAIRVVAKEKPGYPCRISMEEAEVGETLLLLEFPHHEVAGPYAGSGPIFVREKAATAALAAGEIPEVVRTRLLSVRGYDANGMMIQADVVEGADIEACIARQFADEAVSYIHLHNARRGCYSCRVDRA